MKQLVPTPLAQFPAVSFTVAEPYGVVLIMSPWNYPFMLCMEPLIGALAAGNCCILKPSAYSEAVSAVIVKLIKKYFQPNMSLLWKWKKKIQNCWIKDLIISSFHRWCYGR